MKFFNKAKDGGKESPVDGYFLCEIKNLFSVVLLKFNKGQREDYHSHAFNAYTWFICGDLYEEDISGNVVKYKKRLIPKFTPRDKVHRVKALETSWCFTVRGPWKDTWFEVDSSLQIKRTLTHKRVLLEEGIYNKSVGNEASKFQS